MKTANQLLYLLFITSFLGCTEENNYYTTAEGLGKVNVYIEGNITNEEATVKLKTEVGTLTENIYIRNTRALTNIVINAVTDMQNIEVENAKELIHVTINAAGSLYNINISGNSKLTDLEINGHNGSIANRISIGDNLILSNISIKKIKTIKGLGLANINVASTLNCYDLEEVKNDIYLSLSSDVENKINFFDLKHIGLDSDDGNFWKGKFIQLNFPKLESINTLILWDTFYKGVEINTLTFPSLKSIKSLEFYFGNGVQNFNLPLLERCDNFYFRRAKPIVNMPNLNYCKTFTSGVSRWTSNDVNSLLDKFLNVQPFSGKTIDLSEEAAPTGQGLIDKETLINQGNTVLTN